MPSFLQILLLAVIQGAAELLPVSSSAHVIVAERLLGLDPSTPAMTFLLVMLHTGTMFAVLVYFWPQWRAIMLDHGQQQGTLKRPLSSRREFFESIALATVATCVAGLGLKIVIEKALSVGAEGPVEIEQIFGNLKLISASLFAAGLLIIVSGRRAVVQNERPWSRLHAVAVGAVQGLCLPFRGFSRSGATISSGILLGLSRDRAESFSFALAVVLTPAVILRETLRLLRAVSTQGLVDLLPSGIAGMVFSFAAGLVALRLLSRVLQEGRWSFFGYYCLIAAAGVQLVYRSGF